MIAINLIARSARRIRRDHLAEEIEKFAREEMLSIENAVEILHRRARESRDRWLRLTQTASRPERKP